MIWHLVAVASVLHDVFVRGLVRGPPRTRANIGERQAGVRVPTRALVVDTAESWIYTLSRAARRAGVSEIVVCENLHAVENALRSMRFDIVIFEASLDPNDDWNTDGIKVLEAIRATDGGGPRCVLVTGWQGGDRMALQAKAQRMFGIDWAYAKEKYEARDLTTKLSELLKETAARPLSWTTAMAALGAAIEPWLFEGQLVGTLCPMGGVRTLYVLVSQLLDSAIPLTAMRPEMPMEKGTDGVWIGLYWSRALATAIAVSLTTFARWQNDDSTAPNDLFRVLPDGVMPNLIERSGVRNIQGSLWELPGIARDAFPG